MNIPEAPDLTDRQWEVVELVGGKGLSYKRAARALDISYETVRKHAEHIRDRSGLRMDPHHAVLHLWYRFNGRDDAA